jgi:hypothetical protein
VNEAQTVPDTGIPDTGIDVDKLPPRALAAAFELVPGAHAALPIDNSNDLLFRRAVSARSKAFEPIVREISCSTGATLTATRDCVEYVIRLIEHGIVSGWRDMFMTIPAGHIRVLDTRGKNRRVKCRVLGPPGDNLGALREFAENPKSREKYASDYPGFWYHSFDGGVVGRSYGYSADTDTALLMWYCPYEADAPVSLSEVRATLRLERLRIGGHHLYPTRGRLEAVLAYGKTYRLEPFKPVNP